MSSVLRDELSAKRYTPWDSLVTGLAATTMAVGLSSVLGLQTHHPLSCSVSSAPCFFMTLSAYSWSAQGGRGFGRECRGPSSC